MLRRLGAFPREVVVGMPHALGVLTPSERLVVLLRYGAGWSVGRVAGRLKVSERQVQRLGSTAVEKMVEVVQWE